ncbi:MAG: homoserine dehydrogenase [Kiritimatiellae bacterium]|nr:homoserine dehydrogenase [Kiritimatiellia bacterium]MDW8459252.1 homoserine dehydrogenase [Verrucomicrobiota bacterium]
MKEIGLAVLGFGTVGAGVVEGLQRNAELIARRVGARPVLRWIADLDLERDRGVRVDRSLLTRDARSAVEDPRVDIVIELIGGVGIARELVTRALELGKPVITANKKMLAEYGSELFGLAAARDTELAFEASVGGGIPIIKALREGLVANNILEIHGILNGTCNYILTRMELENLPFSEALRAAQAAGFAEAEPSLDIDGLDTAHKAAILASLAYGFPVPMSAVHVEGIRGLAIDEIRYAGELGYRVKLLAIIKREANGISVRVHPALVPARHMLGSVDGVFNAVLVRGDIVGDTLYYGRGAGRLPTASAVLADVADVAARLARGGQTGARALPLGGASEPLVDMSEIRTRYYLRMSLLDQPGTLARVAAALGAHRVSIASMVQKERRQGEHVPVIMLTHAAEERAFRAALAEIDALDVVGAPTVALRIQDFE